MNHVLNFPRYYVEWCYNATQCMTTMWAKPFHRRITQVHPPKRHFTRGSKTPNFTVQAHCDVVDIISTWLAQHPLTHYHEMANNQYESRICRDGNFNHVESGLLYFIDLSHQDAFHSRFSVLPCQFGTSSHIAFHTHFRPVSSDVHPQCTGPHSSSVNSHPTEHSPTILQQLHRIFINTLISNSKFLLVRSLMESLKCIPEAHDDKNISTRTSPRSMNIQTHNLLLDHRAYLNIYRAKSPVTPPPALMGNRIEPRPSLHPASHHMILSRAGRKAKYPVHHAQDW